MKIKIAWMMLAVALAGAAGTAVWRKNAQASASATTSMTEARTVANVVAGKQLIEVTVKEGYQPRAVEAKAGMPAVLQMKTNGTYDCSTTFMIPSLGMRAQLPSTGETDIQIPAQKAGTDLVATCGMGMYSLEVKFD
jgi:plastocyanin domain-containing protein